jgi:hypothetical protein
MFSFENWVRLLGDPTFKFGFFSFLATCFSLGIKFSARPGGPTREDWAFGFDLAQVSIFALLTDGSAKVVSAFIAGQTEFGRPVVAKLIWLPTILVAMVCLLLIFSLLVRYLGWKDAFAVKSELRKYYLAGVTHVEHIVELHPRELNWFGVLFPLPLGIFYMAIVVSWMAGE